MPKLTRAMFLDAVEVMMDNARRNFLKDGWLASTLIGVDKMCHQAIALGRPPDTLNEDPAMLERIKQSGMYVLPAPFREHQESVLAFLNEHKAVAAITIDEAWTARGGVAVDVLEMDISIADHPSRAEGIAVMGTWPREHVFRALTAEIIRHPSGNRLGPVRHLHEEFPQADVFVEWLSGMLPQPYR